MWRQKIYEQSGLFFFIWVFLQLKQGTHLDPGGRLINGVEYRIIF